MSSLFKVNTNQCNKINKKVHFEIFSWNENKIETRGRLFLKS